MTVPVTRYLRILVVGSDNAKVAEVIERELQFRTLVVEPSAAADTIRNGADIGAIVATRADVEAIVKARDDRGLRMPIFLLTTRDQGTLSAPYLQSLGGVIVADSEARDFYKKRLVAGVQTYLESLLTPFFGTLMQYEYEADQSWACPGHQGGDMLMRHPAGRLFFEQMGAAVFRDDICNATVAAGDRLIHEGPALDAQRSAARVFGSDRTYFVLNGTSASNRIVNTALLRSGDVVLFDRNNHKSNHHGALMIANAVPIYLESDRNSFGMVGPVDWCALEEGTIRARIREHPRLRGTDAWKKDRPVRAAIIEQCTYDGTLYNAARILEKIGHLCEYIHFDEAWSGFAAFHPLLEDHFAMGLALTPEDPGIIATQSTHKQLAGFSQASQIHVRDAHIHDKPFRVNHKRFNEMFMLQASTSPFYPLFASLDVNAQMHADQAGRVLWDDTIRLGIEARKAVRKRLGGFLDPFVPDLVTYSGDTVRWEDVPTDVLARDQRFWQLAPGATWHGYHHLGPDVAMIDPTKLMLTTPGIDHQTGDYRDTGIPATVLGAFLREGNVIPERNDLNSILFLMTPAIGEGRTAMLLAALERFRDLYDADASIESVVPRLAARHQARYAGYSLRQLCHEMHDFYRTRNVKELQRLCFRHQSFPQQAMTARDAIEKMVGGDVEYIPMANAHNRIAATLAVIDPPGIGIIVPGERYDDAARPMIDYFLVFEEGCNRFPGFASEVQGVYQVPENGRVNFYTYVVKE